MDKIAIEVNNLSKLYRLGLLHRHSHSFRDTLTSLIKRDKQKIRDDTIWALKNVSFEINKGEIVGIIGRNGSGKTTLLKIISRITTPTEGSVLVKGRTGALLEVGTGFHPELTGKENIYLNGAILGMKKDEIKNKYESIIEFAELKKFIDTPVKRYSSGMYVRLAFSVAAHLEPEILLVDEVLAVGDVEFQRKCIGKMQEVSQGEGRTIVFVSHNMGSVQSICKRGIFLKDGSVFMDGNIEKTVSSYLGDLKSAANVELVKRKDRTGLGNIRLIDVKMTSKNDIPTNSIISGHSAKFLFTVSKVLPSLDCAFTLYDMIGIPVVSFDSQNRSPEDRFQLQSGNMLICEVNELLLLPGQYRMNVLLKCNGIREDRIEGALFITVQEGIVHGRSVRHSSHGKVNFAHKWIVPRR